MNRYLRSLLLIVGFDVGLINLAFWVGYYARYRLELFLPVDDAFAAPYVAYLPFQFWHTILLIAFLYLDGVYQRRRGGSWFEELYRVINATTKTFVILIAVTFLLQPLVYSRLLLLEIAILTIVFLSGLRLVRRALRARARRQGLGMDRVLIIGAGEMGRAVMRNLVASPGLGYHVVGFVDDDPAKGDLGRFRALGNLDQLENVLKNERVDEVIIALPWMYQRKIISLVRVCDSCGARARVVPDLFQLSLNRVDFDDLGGIPLIGLKEAKIPRLGRLVKRGLDMVLAIIIMSVIFIPMLILAALIRLESPGAVIFRQQRVGERGQVFWIYKFRSMREGADEEKEHLKDLNEADGPLFKIRDDPRLTRIGRWIRRTSIDELPNLINVFFGEMSLVGPRPGLPEEVAQYQPWHRQRLEVAPGITGLWQVSGRSNLAFDEMCLLDIYYIENWSLSLDLMILLRTIPHVLLGEGAY